MSRPALVPLDSATANWLTRLNDNFEKLIDAPMPMALYADVTALGVAADPKLYKDTLALVGASGSARLYSSDGTTWTEYRPKLANIVDLVPGAATIADIKNAYNGLLADMQSTGWML